MDFLTCTPANKVSHQLQGKRQRTSFQQNAGGPQPTLALLAGRLPYRVHATRSSASFNHRSAPNFGMNTVTLPSTTRTLVADSLLKNGKLVVQNFESLTDNFLFTKEQFKEVQRALAAISARLAPPWPKEDWGHVVKSWALVDKTYKGLLLLSRQSANDGISVINQYLDVIPLMYDSQKSYAEKSIEILYLIMRLEEIRSLTADFNAMSDALQQHLETFLIQLSKFADEEAPKMPQDIQVLEVDLERLKVELNKFQKEAESFLPASAPVLEGAKPSGGGLAVTSQGAVKFLNILGGKASFVGSSSSLTALAEAAPIGFHTGLIAALNPPSQPGPAIKAFDHLGDVATEMSITKEKLALQLASTENVALLAHSVRFAKKSLHMLFPRFGRIVNVCETVLQDANDLMEYVQRIQADSEELNLELDVYLTTVTDCYHNHRSILETLTEPAKNGPKPRYTDEWLDRFVGWCVNARDSVETHWQAEGFNPDEQSDRLSSRILDSRKNYRQQSKGHIIDTLVLFVEWYDRWWRWLRHKHPCRHESDLWDPIAYDSYKLALDLLFDLGVEKDLPPFISRPLKGRSHHAPTVEERVREGDRRSRRYHK